ncbi:MAG TPA: hypothetical protein VFU69_03590 [Ktedonobacterales bacterium]|nr:hypothetical protein [Ktedonobacterales bacterium]
MFPSGCYERTNPLRREAGVRLLAERPAEALFMQARPGTLAFLTLTEMEVSRRVVEAPQVSLKPVERKRLLTEQGMYLRRLYEALARQIGEAAALKTHC